MRRVTSVLPRRRMAVVLAVALGVAGCATAAGTSRVIAIVPGFPLASPLMQVAVGERVTWINGDPSRGDFRIAFDPAPGAPEVSPTSGGVYNAQFGTPGTYKYTITASNRMSVPLVARSGQVVVGQKPEAAPPPTPAAEDPVPIGTGINRLQGGAEASAAHRYRPEQGIVLKVGRGTAEPSRLRPGVEVTLRVTYTVLAPPDAKPLKVKEQRTVRYGNQDLRRLEKDVAVSVGTYSSESRLIIPPDAAEGAYTVTTVVEIPGVALARGEASSVFSVAAP